MIPESALVLAVVVVVAAAAMWSLRRRRGRATRRPDMLNLGETWIASIRVATGPRMPANDVQRLLSRHYISCWGWTGDDTTATFSIPRPAIERATRLLLEAGIPVIMDGQQIEPQPVGPAPAVAPRHVMA